MEALALTKKIVNLLDNKKAVDVKAIQISDLTIIADYFVIATGTNTTQVKALADEVEVQLKELGITPARIEGYQSNSWILLDYSNVVVHIFYKDTRDFYDLERLWSDGQQLDLAQLLEHQEA